MAPLDELVADPGAYAYFGTCTELAGPPVVVWDLAVGQDPVPDSPVEVSLPADGDGEPVDGVVIWFEATLDDGILLGNTPPRGGHWGQLLVGFPGDCPVVDGRVTVIVDPDEQGRSAQLAV